MSAGDTTPIEEDFLPIRDVDHILGDEKSATTIVEFGDYECPGCAEAYKIFKKLLSEKGASFRFVFRHYAYANLHPHAELAAQAAESAGAQGKFWEMHDLLFEDQDHLELDDLIERADKLSLDEKQFRDDLKSEKYLDRVREDFKTGVQNGVFGTPSVFVNGIRHNGDLDYEAFADLVEKNTEGRVNA